MINTSSFLQKAIEQQLSEGNMITLHVTGRSMRPYFDGNGDELITLSKPKPDELKHGMIILFLYNKRYIFHRIVNKMNDLLIVQGDGNCIQTEQVRSENVVALVRFVTKKGKNKKSPYNLNGQIYWYIWYRLRPVRKYLLLIYNLLH